MSKLANVACKECAYWDEIRAGSELDSRRGICRRRAPTKLGDFVTDGEPYRYAQWPVTLGHELCGDFVRGSENAIENTELVEKDDGPTHSVDEFCQLERISKPMFYKLIKQGRGPKVMKIGTRTTISHRERMAWQRRMEVQS